MKWTQNGYDHFLAIGECSASIVIVGTRNHATLSATVRTPLFPAQKCDDFHFHADAKAWCEQWIGFAVELLSLRHAVEELREQRQKDFAEILQLRDELRDYKYPHTAESEVSA